MNLRNARHIEITGDMERVLVFAPKGAYSSDGDGAKRDLRIWSKHAIKPE